MEGEKEREGKREGGRGREGRGDDEIGTCYEEPDCKNYMYVIYCSLSNFRRLPYARKLNARNFPFLLLRISILEVIGLPLTN